MDIQKIRNDFPYLDKDHLGRDVIYLDTAATSQKPIQVLEAVDNYYKYQNANPHRGAHYLSMVATNAYEDSRDYVKEYIGAAHREEIIFTRNATEALNIIAYSYAMKNLKEGDEILITILEHHANLVPWQRIRDLTGAKLVYAYLNDDYSLDYDDLKSKINENTKIVSFTGASNVNSEIIDVKKITGWAHEVGAISIVDGAQLIPHLKTDVADLDCDFLVFSGHKLLAPMGIGVLYGKKEILENMDPFLTGGDMIEYVYEQDVTFAELPYKFEAGTQDVGGAVGLAAAIKYMEDIGIDEIYNYESELTRYTYELIKDIPRIKTFYPENVKTGAVLSFTFDDIHPHDIASILDNAGVAVRSGHHCAMPLHKYLGVSSTTRASFAFYNTKEEAEIFANELLNVRKVMGL